MGVIISHNTGAVSHTHALSSMVTCGYLTYRLGTILTIQGPVHVWIYIQNPDLNCVEPNLTDLNGPYSKSSCASSFGFSVVAL